MSFGGDMDSRLVGSGTNISFEGIRLFDMPTTHWGVARNLEGEGRFATNWAFSRLMKSLLRIQMELIKYEPLS